ncbi:MAG: tRNA (adenosine(37)-N6)-dimethylallyltransferase MiaA [Patescibacteria group bacterium]
MPSKPKVIVVLGTNASGKTSLGVELAKKVNGAIISADSRQVFLGMDLGTGKEGKKAKRHGRPVRIIKGIPQYLVDIKKPTQSYSVALWQKEAAKLVEEIWDSGKIPMVVGGTGLYIDALLKGFQLPKTSNTLRQKLARQSLGQLLNRLQKLDPKTFKKIDQKNKRRIIRALEVCILTKQPFSAQQKQQKPDWDILKIGVTHPRDILYQRIDQRVDRRLKQGMISEVRKLRKQGLSWKKLNDFGLEYRFMAKYLKGELGKEEMIQQLKFAIHHFAKRQQTWFKKDKQIHWITTKKQAESLVKKFL